MSLTFPINLLHGGGAIPITDADFTALIAESGLIRDAIYSVGEPPIWYRATGADTYERMATGNYPASAPAYAAQFLTARRALPIRSVIVSASGLIANVAAIVGYRCVTPGSAGTLTVHDDTGSSDATKLRETRAYTAATANTYYPMAADDQCALLFDTGCYVTCPTGGVYVFDVLDVNSDVAGYEGSGMLVTPVRAAATGLAIAGPASILSLKVIAPGSAGTLTVHDATAASDATKLRLSIAFGSLAVGQLIPFGGKGGAPTFGNAYVTVPTGGIVLLNQFPV